MATTRTELRDATLAALVAAASLSAFLKESSRLEPIDDVDLTETLPDVLQVYSPSRVDAPLAPYGHQYTSDRSVTVNVEAYVSAVSSDAVEAAMDTVEASIATALLGNQSWLDEWAAHPSATWTYAVKPLGGRFRGWVSASFTGRLAAEEL